VFQQGHACFHLSTQPVVIEDSLAPPIIPEIVNRGYIRGKRLCSASDCPNQRGAQKCTTSRCAKCCIAYAVEERRQNRDGSALCSAHRLLIGKALVNHGLTGGPLTTTNQATVDGNKPANSPEPSSSTQIPHTPASSTVVRESPDQATSSSSTRPSNATGVGIAGSSATTRKAPRAMPLNVQFTKPDIIKDGLNLTATQRAHREDTAAQAKIRFVLFYPDVCQYLYVILCDSDLCVSVKKSSPDCHLPRLNARLLLSRIMRHSWTSLVSSK
jgi:hypothetical protein